MKGTRYTLKIATPGMLAKAVSASGDHLPASMARAKSFNPTTAPARHAQDEASWHPRLEHSEKMALHHYTDKHHIGPALNNLHRWGERHEGDDFTPLVAHHADTALAKSRVSEQHGIVVHRGIAGPFARKLKDAHETGDGVKGTEFKEKGYLSTSLVPHVAHRFMHSLMDPEHAVTIHHIIHAHHGTHLGSVQAMSKVPDEHEMLGGRGAVMRHIAFTEHDPHPEAVAAVRAHAAATGRTVGSGPGQVPYPRHFVLHSEITHHEAE